MYQTYNMYPRLLAKYIECINREPQMYQVLYFNQSSVSVNIESVPIHQGYQIYELYQVY